VPASERDGAGMRRHVHSGNHAAESFVSFIPLFDDTLLLKALRSLVARRALIRIREFVRLAEKKRKERSADSNDPTRANDPQTADLPTDRPHRLRPGRACSTIEARHLRHVPHDSERLTLKGSPKR